MGLSYEVYLTNYPSLEQKHNYATGLREQPCPYYLQNAKNVFATGITHTGQVNNEV